MRPRARRKYLLDLLEGAAWGALLSVLWLELALLVLMALGVALLLRAMQRWRRGGSLWGLGGLLLSMLAVMGLAWAAPLKFVDQPLYEPLTAEHLPLEALVAQLERQDFRVRSELPTNGRWVTLPSRQPTYAQLDAALRAQVGLRVRIGYCGTGASLLRGMHPVGGFELVEP